MAIWLLSLAIGHVAWSFLELVVAGDSPPAAQHDHWNSLARTSVQQVVPGLQASPPSSRRAAHPNQLHLLNKELKLAGHLSTSSPPRLRPKDGNRRSCDHRVGAWGASSCIAAAILRERGVEAQRASSFRANSRALVCHVALLPAEETECSSGAKVARNGSVAAVSALELDLQPPEQALILFQGRNAPKAFNLR